MRFVSFVIFCFIFVKIKKSRNDSWTITSVYQFPLLINFKDCYLWPNRLFKCRIPRDPRVIWLEIPTSIFIHFFENIFVRFLNLKRLFWLIIDDMIGWQKAGRSDPTESDWVIISQWLPYFWKKRNFINSKWVFGHFWPKSHPQNSPFPTSPDNLNFLNW